MRADDDERLKKARAVIRSHSNNWQLNKAQQKELDDAYETIKKVQASCYHSMTKYVGITQVHMYCRYCGKISSL